MKHLFIAITLLFSLSSIGQTTLQPTEYDAVVVFKIADEKMVPEQGAIVRLENIADKTVRRMGFLAGALESARFGATTKW